MAKISFGRRLLDGVPMGSEVSVDASGETATALGELGGVLVSNPVWGEWAGCSSMCRISMASARAFVIDDAENVGRPDRVHPNCAEHVRVLAGEYAFDVDGDVRGAGAGIRVAAGTPNAMRNEAPEFASCLVETRPAGTQAELVWTLSGLAHDGKVTRTGAPGVLQTMVVAEAVGADTFLPRFISLIFL